MENISLARLIDLYKNDKKKNEEALEIYKGGFADDIVNRGLGEEMIKSLNREPVRESRLKRTIKRFLKVLGHA